MNINEKMRVFLQYQVEKKHDRPGRFQKFGADITILNETDKDHQRFDPCLVLIPLISHE